MTRAAQVLATRSNARKSAGPRTLQGKAVGAEDFANACVLDRRRLYERRIEHSLYRTRGELRNQRLREKEPATKEGGVVRSTGILPHCSTHLLRCRHERMPFLQHKRCFPAMESDILVWIDSKEDGIETSLGRNMRSSYQDCGSTILRCVEQ